MCKNSKENYCVILEETRVITMQETHYRIKPTTHKDILNNSNPQRDNLYILCSQWKYLNS